MDGFKIILGLILFGILGQLLFGVGMLILGGISYLLSLPLRYPFVTLSVIVILWILFKYFINDENKK